MCLSSVAWLGCGDHMHEVSTSNTLGSLTTAPLSSKFPRLQEKRQSLMEKLLPRSRLMVARDVAPLSTEEKGKEESSAQAQRPISKSSTVAQQHSDTRKEVDTEKEISHCAEEQCMTPASASATPDVPQTGERLFVFRHPPESCDRVDAPKRKRKKNFLNLKKGSVAPTNLPWDSQC